MGFGMHDLQPLIDFLCQPMCTVEAAHNIRSHVEVYLFAIRKRGERQTPKGVGGLVAVTNIPTVI